ncbi:MAG: cytidylyltransferase domain-containing protein [Candidatus Binatia bacterium]
MRVLGIIPARGGSKEVPRKNIRMVAGRPLIAYTIEAAKGSRLLTDFVTSTEDLEIATVAKELGSPLLMRPKELAADDSPMLTVVQHALTALESDTVRFDYVTLLQPTTPQRFSEDIDAALTLLIQTGADSVVSVYQVSDHHPARMYRLVNGRLVPYDSEPTDRLRQGLPAVYHRNGAIYACRRALIKEKGTLVGLDTRPYIMPRGRSINIDDELDLVLADLLLRRQQGSDQAQTR